MYKFVFFAFILILSGCHSDNISNKLTCNNSAYYQNDYEYHCFEGNKTFSEIIVCLKTQNNAERIQNMVTNELITDKKGI